MGRKSPHGRRKPSPARLLSLHQHLRRRRKITIGWVTAVVLGLISAAWADHHGWLLAQHGDWRDGHSRWCTVLGVMEGPTLILADPDGQRETTAVRLWGVRTLAVEPRSSPSVAERSQDPAVAIAAELARGLNVRVELPAQPRRDPDGLWRVVVRLADGTTLNERLLASGWASAEEPAGRPEWERFTLIERQAREDHIGFWSLGRE